MEKHEIIARYQEGLDNVALVDDCIFEFEFKTVEAVPFLIRLICLLNGDFLQVRQRAAGALIRPPFNRM